MGFSEILTLAAAGSAVCCGPLICPSLSSLHISGRRMGGPRETSCGLAACRPHWLQVLASKKVYMFFYGCIGIIKVGLVFIKKHGNKKKVIFSGNAKFLFICKFDNTGEKI